MQYELKKLLAGVSKPGRYTGGEFGTIRKNDPSNLKIALSFPDLYEIGMSNVAMKILYNMLGSIEGVTCERVFAPAPDMEAALRQSGYPLFSLESGTPLAEFDIIAFSIGYELSATNILNILRLGNLPYLRAERGVEDPIVIGGGPVVSNPHPLGDFLDFAFIGEGEDFILHTIFEVAGLKKKGTTREAMRERIKQNPACWDASEPTRSVKKAVFQDFCSHPYNSYLPVPNIKVVQDHGNVEIMRGCPNGCRFCHAGMLYRPLRMKEAAEIDSEVSAQVFRGGYREITLASLSSGDYSGIGELATGLNKKYAPFGVSFALPSLRINSLSLDILENISSVRKSGLTFAVETPTAFWQRGLNKEVSRDKVLSILHEARKRGWRLAKFYFMLGLPLYEEDEVPGIIDFLLSIKNEIRMKLNINISTFVPKPHTPFQWAAQLEEDEALRRIQALKAALGGTGFKVGYHSPAASRIEGLIARGDERVGKLISEAYEKGARLDAWEEHFDRLLWQDVLESHAASWISEIYSAKPFAAVLPWSGINIGVAQNYLKKEYEKAKAGELSPACTPDCEDNCGACRKNGEKVAMNPAQGLKAPISTFPEEPLDWQRVLLSFSKQGPAIFLSHLNCINIFERAFMRSGFWIRFTQGFNPKPKMEFAHPLSLGISSCAELMSLELGNLSDLQNFISELNASLPEGFSLNKVKILKSYVQGEKKISLSSIFWGADYRVSAQVEQNLIDKIRRHIISGDYPQTFKAALHDFRIENNTLHIRWKQINKKGCNISNFLKELLGTDPLVSGLDIARVSILAKDEKENPISYFEAMI